MHIKLSMQPSVAEMKTKMYCKKQWLRCIIWIK
nr:MAG TPA: actin-like protein [Caudoviricetes sp.]